MSEGLNALDAVLVLAAILDELESSSDTLTAIEALDALARLATGFSLEQALLLSELR